MTEPFIGQIQSFGFNFAPRGWQLCAGQLMSISQNTALFSLLGTNFGGNGVQTFGLPDLRGRLPIGQGNGPGLTPRVIGEIGGAENVSILVSNMPSHTHVATFTGTGGGGGGSAITLKASTMQATQSVPGTAGAATLGAPYYADGPAAITGYVNDPNPTIDLTGISGSGAGGITGGTVANALTGNGLPVGIMQPFLCINYSIALQGIFPSRN